MAEQLIRNEQVVSSILTTSSRSKALGFQCSEIKGFVIRTLYL